MLDPMAKVANAPPSISQEWRVMVGAIWPEGEDSDMRFAPDLMGTPPDTQR